jgi:hypothetical protein
MYDRGEIMSKEEHVEILNWLCENFYTFTEQRDLFVEATLYEDDKKVPKIIWDIRNRIIKKEGLEEYAESYNDDFFLKFHGTLQGVTRDKISIIHPGNELSLLMPHRDVNQPCRVHTRFNVYLSLPNMGGTTYYDGHVVEMKERGYVMCRSGMDLHWTEEIHGTSPRITISFGFQLPLNIVDKIYKIPKIKWNIYNTRMMLYTYINSWFSYTVNPKLKACDIPGCIPSLPIEKSSKAYPGRKRGFPPFDVRRRPIY